MVTEEGRKVEIKRIIEECPCIHQTPLLEKICENHIMAKKTAEKIIKQLLEDREIYVVRVKNKKCFMLTSDEAYRGDLPALFAKKTVALRERLDKIEKNFTRHSSDAQQYICDDLCDRIGKTIDDSYRWVKELDRNRGYEAEYEEIGSGIQNLLENTKIDRARIRRALSYSRHVVTALIGLGREMEELTEKRKAMRASKEKEEMANRNKQLYDQTRVLVKDAVGLESALRDLQSVDIESWHDDTETGHLCTSIDHARKQSIEHAEAMSDRVKKLREIAGEQGMSVQAANLDTQVSAIRTNLEVMDGTIKEIETTGQQYELVKTLDSKLSEAESHLDTM